MAEGNGNVGNGIKGIIGRGGNCGRGGNFGSENAGVLKIPPIGSCKDGIGCVGNKALEMGINDGFWNSGGATSKFGWDSGGTLFDTEFTFDGMVLSNNMRVDDENLMLLQ